MKDKLKKLIFLKFFNNKKNFLLFSIFIIAIACSGYVFFMLVQAANLSYTEDFTTTTYKDTLHTSAVWTGNGQVTIKDEFVREDGTKSYIENISNDRQIKSEYPLIFLDDKGL